MRVPPRPQNCIGVPFDKYACKRILRGKCARTRKGVLVAYLNIYLTDAEKAWVVAQKKGVAHWCIAEFVRLYPDGLPTDEEDES